MRIVFSSRWELIMDPRDGVRGNQTAGGWVVWGTSIFLVLFPLGICLRNNNEKGTESFGVTIDYHINAVLWSSLHRCIRAPVASCEAAKAPASSLGQWCGTMKIRDFCRGDAPSLEEYRRWAYGSTVCPRGSNVSHLFCGMAVDKFFTATNQRQVSRPFAHSPPPPLPPSDLCCWLILFIVRAWVGLQASGGRSDPAAASAAVDDRNLFMPSNHTCRVRLG